MKKIDRKLVKWFIGSNVLIDERIQKEVGVLATRTVFGLFVFELVLGLGMSVYANNYHVSDFETLFYLTMFIQIIGTMLLVYGLMLIPMAKKRLLIKEVSPEDKKEVIRGIQHSWIKVAPIEFMVYWVLSSLVDANNNFLATLFSFKEITSALGFTIFFSFFMYLYERKHIKVVNDNK